MDLIESSMRGFTPTVRHPWELARLDVVRKLIARSVTLGSCAIVLDVGCGDTFVVDRLAAENPTIRFYAIDTAFTDDLIAFHRSRIGAPNVFVSSSLDTVTPPLDRHVSLVILMDVLEHIADDEGFLAGLVAHPAMSAGAQLLVTVPAYQTLFCSHDRVLKHYRRYSNRQLRHLLEGSGLTVVDAGYFFFSLLPMRMVQVAKERLLNGQSESRPTGLVTWSGSRWTTSLLKRLLLMDAEIASAMGRMGLTLPGLSNYAICRKSA